MNWKTKSVLFLLPLLMLLASQPAAV